MKNEFLKTRKKISDWLNKYEVNNFTINDDLTVDVDGDVNLSYKILTQIPVKFNKIKGNFTCAGNRLESLEFSPVEVGKDFDCDNNNIKSLRFCPKVIGRNFYCNRNKLKTLQYCPEVIGGSFGCASNDLTSLMFGPKVIGNSFYCNFNRLKTLEFVPDKINGMLNCHHNEITTLVFFPNEVGEGIVLSGNDELGEFQNLRKFDEIYKEHKKQVKEWLEGCVLSNENKKNGKKVKL